MGNLCGKDIHPTDKPADEDATPTADNNTVPPVAGEEAGAEEEIIGELPMLRKDNEPGKIVIAKNQKATYSLDSREVGTRNSRVTLMARPQCMVGAAEEDEKIGNDSRVSILLPFCRSQISSWNQSHFYNGLDPGQFKRKN